MKHYIHLDCLFHSHFVLLESSFLNSTHGCCRSTESCISCNRILIIKNTTAIALPRKALEIIIQIFLMRALFNSLLAKSCIIQPPSNIIMTTQIVQKYIILRQAVHNVQLLLQQTNISGCNCMPGSCHCGYIIKHMAFRLLHGSKIWNNLFRLHNNLSQKQNSRAHNLTDQTHHAHNSMYLWKVPAWGVQFFPYIWHRIDSNNINTFICKEKEVVHHFIEHTGISVIQIPLIRIEGCHYVMSDFRQPGKITRRCGRKYLWYGFLIKGRNIRIVVEEISAHIFSITLTGFFCPFMIL